LNEDISRSPLTMDDEDLAHIDISNLVEKKFSRSAIKKITDSDDSDEDISSDIAKITPSKISIETQEKYSTTLIKEDKGENGDALNIPFPEKHADRYNTSVVHEKYDSTVVHDQTPKGFPKEKVSYRDYYDANIPKELVPTNKPKRLKDKAAKLAAENAASQASTQVANPLQENEPTPSPIKLPQLSQTNSVRIYNIIEEKEKIERFDSDDDDSDTPIYSPTTSNTTHNAKSTDKTTSTSSSTNGNIASVSNQVTETAPLLPSSNNNANINNLNTNNTSKSNWCCSF